MKKILIIIFSLVPLLGISQARILDGQYNDGRFGKPVKDTVRTLYADSNSIKITSGASSLVDTIRVTPSSLTTLTDGATITWNYLTQTNEAKVTLGGNRALSITNLPSGKVVYMTLGVIQDATGSRTLTLPSGTKVINSGLGAVTLTTTAGATDILSFRWNGTTLFCTYGKNYN